MVCGGKGDDDDGDDEGGGGGGGDGEDGEDGGTDGNNEIFGQEGHAFFAFNKRRRHARCTRKKLASLLPRVRHSREE